MPGLKKLRDMSYNKVKQLYSFEVCCIKDIQYRKNQQARYNYEPTDVNSCVSSVSLPSSPLRNALMKWLAAAERSGLHT